MISNPTLTPREFSSQNRRATYAAALLLVGIIDATQKRGIIHYRTKAGRLLVTLDEVIRAILEDELAEVES